MANANYGRSGGLATPAGDDGQRQWVRRRAGGGQTLHLLCKARLVRLERLEGLDHTIELPVTQEGMTFFQMFITSGGACNHKPPFFE